MPIHRFFGMDNVEVFGSGRAILPPLSPQAPPVTCGGTPTTVTTTPPPVTTTTPVTTPSVPGTAPVFVPAPHGESPAEQALLNARTTYSFKGASDRAQAILARIMVLAGIEAENESTKELFRDALWVATRVARADYLESEEGRWGNTTRREYSSYSSGGYAKQHRCGHPQAAYGPRSDATTGYSTYECQWCADVREWEAELAGYEIDMERLVEFIGDEKVVEEVLGRRFVSTAPTKAETDAADDETRLAQAMLGITP